jgi:pimeloyl-ACP methyl ester carboxylesterase
MAVLAHADVTLTYHDTHASGTPVLLVHGTAAALWGRVPEGLAPHRVICYARRGFDGSTGPLPTSLHDHVEDAMAFLDALDIPSCVVVGWSIGGVLALDLALTAPNLVAGLVLLEPPWHVKRALSLRLLRGPIAAAIRGRHDPQAGAKLFLRWALRDATGSEPDATLPAGWWDQMLTNDAAILHEIGLGTGEYLTRRSLRFLTCPVIVLSGDRSDPSFTRAAAKVAAAAPDATLRTVAQSGHAMQVDRPDAIINAVQAIRRSPTD